MPQTSFVPYLEEKKIITMEEYAKFYCGFFIEAILKSIELLPLESSDEQRTRNSEDITLLFEKMRHSQYLIEKSVPPGTGPMNNPTRQIFYTLGNIVTETHFANLSNHLLHTFLQPSPIEVVSKNSRTIPRLE